MSLFRRIFFFSLIGLIAGVFAWPITEIILFFQEYFVSLLLFSIVTGVAVGVFIGSFLGASEGILSMSFVKIKTGMLMGMLFGCIGGLIGFVIGQSMLLFLGTFIFNSIGTYKWIGFSVAKSIGWAGFGICIGISEGIRSKSFVKIRNGLLGGAVGGILGGFFLELSSRVWPETPFARLIGLAILGLCINAFYSVIENRFTKASLFLLNGRLKGREFPVIQKTTQIGKSEKTEIFVSEYKGISDIHAKITMKGDKYSLTKIDSKTYVNDKNINETGLEDGDIIRAGNAQFQFRIK